VEGIAHKAGNVIKFEHVANYLPLIRLYFERHFGSC